MAEALVQVTRATSCCGYRAPCCVMSRDLPEILCSHHASPLTAQALERSQPCRPRTRGANKLPQFWNAKNIPNLCDSCTSVGSTSDPGSQIVQDMHFKSSTTSTFRHALYMLITMHNLSPVIISRATFWASVMQARGAPKTSPMRYRALNFS